jgi:hypothetical protein
LSSDREFHPKDHGEEATDNKKPKPDEKVSLGTAAENVLTPDESRNIVLVAPDTEGTLKPKVSDGSPLPTSFAGEPPDYGSPTLRPKTNPVFVVEARRKRRRRYIMKISNENATERKAIREEVLSQLNNFNLSANEKTRNKIIDLFTNIIMLEEDTSRKLQTHRPE